VGPKNLQINYLKPAQTKNGLKKIQKSHFNAASIFSKIKVRKQSPQVESAQKEKSKKVPKMCPNTKLKKKSNLIASHSQFSILTLNFSDFTKIPKKWTKSRLGARLGRTLRIFFTVPRTDAQQILSR
jgi:ribosomal protein S30